MSIYKKIVTKTEVPLLTTTSLRENINHAYFTQGKETSFTVEMEDGSTGEVIFNNVWTKTTYVFPNGSSVPFKTVLESNTNILDSKTALKLSKTTTRWYLFNKLIREVTTKDIVKEVTITVDYITSPDLSTTEAINTWLNT